MLIHYQNKLYVCMHYHCITFEKILRQWRGLSFSENFKLFHMSNCSLAMKMQIVNGNF